MESCHASIVSVCGTDIKKRQEEKEEEEEEEKEE